MSDKNYTTAEEIIEKVNTFNKSFIKELELDELNEDKLISVKNKIVNEIKANKVNTDFKKIAFINEIKNGLGDKVKSSTNIPNKIKKSFLTKVIYVIKNFFTKF